MYIIRVPRGYLWDPSAGGWTYTYSAREAYAWNNYNTARGVAGTLDNATILQVTYTVVWSNDPLVF